MVGRKKKTPSEEDRISQLPEHLTCEILAHLSTKDAMRTSVLSKRWKNLWQLVPSLDLDSKKFSDFNGFVSFTERFFDPHKESWIRKLRLNIDNSSNDYSFPTSWIDAATTRRIEHLDVRFEYTYLVQAVLPVQIIVQIPLSVFTCETLVHLRLCRTTLGNAEFVSLPCLKIIHLENIRCPNYEATLEKLISGSPALEDLTIIRMSYEEKKKVFQVRSHTLKRIDINEFTQVVIDTPLLQCLRTKIDSTKNYTVSNLGFFNTLDIDIVFNGIRISSESMILGILTDILRVRDLVIGSITWKAILLYKTAPSLQFRYISHLTTRFYISDLETLPSLLESCPKLESLILEVAKNFLLIDRVNKEQKVIFSTVPRCLASSLKFVEFKRLIPKYEGEMELVRYFLKNSTILEKLKFSTYYNKKPKYEVVKELLAMPRCSSACAVHVL